MSTEKATFGAGCFWGVEATFAAIPGVTSTAVGYEGGKLDRPTYDLGGRELIAGWQPNDLPRVLKHDVEFHAGNGWPDAFNFHRPHTPVPDAMR